MDGLGSIMMIRNTKQGLSYNYSDRLYGEKWDEGVKRASRALTMQDFANASNLTTTKCLPKVCHE